MPLYKPSYEQALKIVLRHIRPEGPPVPLGSTEAAGAVAARDVVAPGPFPARDLSMRDGVAVRPDSDRSESIRTGEPLPAWATTVVPTEQIPESPVNHTVHFEERPMVVTSGAEYQAGDLVVGRGEPIDHHHVAQMQLLGIESVETCAPLKALVITFDRQPFSSAVCTWLEGFLSTHGPVQLECTTLDSIEKLANTSSIHRQDLIILASDGAPGRYDEIKHWVESAPAPFEPLFWKVNLHPGRHMGFGRLGGVPLLVLPDLFFKTVLSAYAFLPRVMAAWSGRELFTRPASWVDLPEIHYPYPCLVPLRFAAERAGLEVFAKPLHSSFSARWVSTAAGYTILSRPPILDEQFETTILARLQVPKRD